MISLGQIRLLEEKIEKVIQRIQNLEEENKILVEKNLVLGKEKENLLFRISSFETDQEQIEKGILSALDKLNTMESAVIKETISNTVKSQELQPKSDQNQKVEVKNPPINEQFKNETKSNSQIAQETQIQNETEDFNIEIEEEIEIPSSINDQNPFDIF